MTVSDIHNDVNENATAVAATNGSNSIPHAPCSVGKAMPRTFTGRGVAAGLLLNLLSAGVDSRIVLAVVVITQY